MAIITKRPRDKHFTLPISDKANSDRMILPGADNCGVKVTVFRPLAGFVGKGVIFRTNETVYVASGFVLVKAIDADAVRLGSGSFYHVPAGEAYDLTAESDAVLICTFSAADGQCVADDA